LNAAQNVRGQLIKTARREVPGLYGLDAITDDAERRRTLEHLLDDNAYVLRAADRGLPVGVRYLHLSWRGR
jgi:Ni,Fe-hydrogenase III component G